MESRLKTPFVYALDAGTGARIWERSLGAPVPLSALPCGNINPMGVTGTPTIDPAAGILEDRVHRRTHVGLARSSACLGRGISDSNRAHCASVRSLGNPLPDCLCASRCSLVHIPNHVLPILAETVNHAAVDNSRNVWVRLSTHQRPHE
jgi:hypothetical protein